MKVIKEIDHDVRVIKGVRLFVRQYIWNDGASSFCVLNAETEDELREDDFDHMPADAEIEAQPPFRTWRLTAAHPFHDAPEIGCTACEAISPGDWRERYPWELRQETAMKDITLTMVARVPDAEDQGIVAAELNAAIDASGPGAAPGWDLGRLVVTGSVTVGIREHVRELHPRVKVTGMTDEAVAREHTRQHHQFGSHSHHHGPNAGPHARPAGWRDGSGVVRIDRQAAMRKPGVTAANAPKVSGALVRALRGLTGYELGCLMEAGAIQRGRWAARKDPRFGELTYDTIDAAFFADAARRLKRGRGDDEGQLARR